MAIATYSHLGNYTFEDKLLDKLLRLFKQVKYSFQSVNYTA